MTQDLLLKIGSIVLLLGGLYYPASATFFGEATVAQLERIAITRANTLWGHVSMDEIMLLDSSGRNVAARRNGGNVTSDALPSTPDSGADMLVDGQYPQAPNPYLTGPIRPNA